MSLLEHLRSSSRAATAPPAASPAPAPNPAPTPSPSPALEPPVRSRAPIRNEALVELKSRVHEELIHELDPEQLLGDLSFTSPARRAVEQAAEERLGEIDGALGRQD